MCVTVETQPEPKGEPMEKVYFATIYKDEDGEASVQTSGLGWFTSTRKAEVAVQESIHDRRWPLWSATIDEGHLEHYVTEDGIDLPSFEETEGGQRIYFGPDWREVETL